MNQSSAVGFGPDATVFAGYAQSANDRLGNIDFVFENTGANNAYIKLMQYTGASPSGYALIGDAFTVAAGGQVTRSYVLLSKRVAFFGSGNTTVNISTVLRNKADLRGAQIDIVASVGRRGWGLDPGFDAPTLTKKYGSVTGAATSGGNISAGAGNISTTGPNYDQTQSNL
jgi:hypothetical protein